MANEYGIPDGLGDGGAYLASGGASGSPDLKTILRTQFAAIHPPVADATAMQAIESQDRSDGMAVFKQDTAKWWYYDADSSASAGATVILPDDSDGDGRWLLASDSDLATLALTTSGNGASLIGVQDAGNYWAGTTVEAILAAIGLLLGGGTITKIQLITGTIASGTSTVSTGITVTAATKAFPFPSTVVSGSTNFGSLAHILASNVVGGPGTGAVTIKAIGNDGAVDADAGCTYAALLIN